MISTLSFLLELLQLLHRLFVRSKHCFPPQQNEKCVLNNEYHRAVIKYVYTLLAKQNLFGLFEKRFEEDSGLKKSYQMFYRVAQKAQLLFWIFFHLRFHNAARGGGLLLMSELMETIETNVVLNDIALDGRGNIRARVNI